MASFVLIDDNASPALTGLRDALGRRAIKELPYPASFDPEELPATKKAINGAAVLLVDDNLRDDSDRQASQFEPRDAAGLLANLPSILDSAPKESARVIFTADLDRLCRPVTGTDKASARGREHVVARQNDVEWVLAKGEAARPKFQKDLRVLLELRSAVLKARKLDFADPLEALLQLMSVPKARWRERAIEQIESLHPPLQALESGDVLAGLRWLLHIALPFPGCLCEFRDLALSLRIDPKWLRGERKFSDNLAASLSQVRYRGALSNFQGPRWWRAGVDSLVWKDSKGRFHDKRVLQQIAAKWLRVDSKDLKLIDVEDPVLVVDEDFRRLDSVKDISNAVQIQPDDWPAAVEQPWIEIAKTKSVPRIKSLIVPKDVNRAE